MSDEIKTSIQGTRKRERAATRSVAVRSASHLGCAVVAFLLGMVSLGWSAPELRVKLKFVEGRLAVDFEQSSLVDPTPAAERDELRMLRAIDDRLKARGLACRWHDISQEWDVTPVETLQGDWATGAAALDAWSLVQGGGKEYRWSRDVLIENLMDTQLAGVFFEWEKVVPLTLKRDEFAEAVMDRGGVILFMVSAPITEEEIAKAVVVDPRDARLAPGLTRSLRQLEGRLWWSAEVKGLAEDYMRLIGLTPAEAWGPVVFFLPPEYNNAQTKQVTLLGPAPLATLKLKSTATAENERKRQMLLASYNLLPTQAFRELRKVMPEKLSPEKGVPDTYFIDLSTTGLRAAGFRPVTLSLVDTTASESRLLALGYDQEIVGNTLAVNAKFLAPEPSTPKVGGAKKTPAEKRNLLELWAGIAKGTKYTAGTHYIRKRAGGDNTLELGANTAENIPGAEVAYTFDYVGFAELGRRLSIAIDGGREPATDRQLSDLPAEEKKDSLTLVSTLEIWRNFNRQAGGGPSRQSLNLELTLGAARSTLATKDRTPANAQDERYDLATGGLKVTYSRSGFAGGLPWTDVIAEGGSATDTDGGGEDYLWTKTSLAHRRLLVGSVRWDLRADFHSVDDGAPLAEVPSFGGEDSVRGFSRDSARGRGAWSIKNELWFRPPAEMGLPKAMGALIRRFVIVALFCDVGGVMRPFDHAVRHGASGGIGLRYVEGPVTIRADWAHSLGKAGSLPSSHAGYLTFSFRPAF